VLDHTQPRSLVHPLHLGTKGAGNGADLEVAIGAARLAVIKDFGVVRATRTAGVNHGAQQAMAARQPSPAAEGPGPSKVISNSCAILWLS
jgi:hypothetical protein